MEFEFTNKVLFIDDDHDFLGQVNAFFEKEGVGIDMITSSSASEGLSLLGEKDFDAVVSCFKVQDTEYVDFLNKIRNKREMDIPFVLLIDKKDNELILKALKEGVNRVIHKEENVTLSCKILTEILNQEIQQYLKNKEVEHYRKEFNNNFELFRI